MSPAIGVVGGDTWSSAHIFAAPFPHPSIHPSTSSDASNRRRNYYKNKKRTYSMLVEELKSMIQVAPVEKVLPKFLLEQQ
jgi:hypothetical protein